jgi:5-methylcytosine-specific restriction endonuclease McrA
MSIKYDLIGQTFGRLTVIKKAPNIVGKKREYGAWECLCNCGKIKIVATVHLNRGTVQSCGCIVKEGRTTLSAGQKFGRLTTIIYKDNKWSCLCDCGEYVEVSSYKLANDNTKSCGCLKIEISKTKSDKLIAGRRKNEPHIASARRVWQNTYLYRDENTISFEQFMNVSQQNCFYCGIEPNTKYNFFAATSTYSSKKSEAEGLFIYNGMDRVDNTKSHTIDNVVACCPICNRAKSDRTQKDFLEWILRLTITDFHPLIIPQILFPENGSLATSIKCVFYNHKNDTDMSVEEYYSISQMSCFYCNGKPNNTFNRAKTDKKSSDKAKQNGEYIYNGIDRIDRSQPHNKNNVVPCCYYCNHTKSKLALPEFQAWIRRVQDFQKSKLVDNVKIA